MAALSSFYPRLSFADVKAHTARSKTLSFYNLHTDESLRVKIWEDGRYLPEALSDVNYILRDHRTGEVIDMDPGILELLYRIKKKAKTQVPFHVISGYRSVETNRMLRRQGKGVARHSFHMLGKAVDIRLPNFPLASLRAIAMKLRGGGVGYYPRSHFIHLDCGPIRHWNG